MQLLMQRQMFPMIFLIRYILSPILRVVMWIVGPFVILFMRASHAPHVG